MYIYSALFILQELYKACASPRVVDLSKRRSGKQPVTDTASPRQQLIDITAGNVRLGRKATEVSSLLLSLSLLLLCHGTKLSTVFIHYCTDFSFLIHFSYMMINTIYFLFQLQVAVTNLLAANRTGGQIRTDFSAFPTPAFAKVSSAPLQNH